MYPQVDLKSGLGQLFLKSPAPLGRALPSFCDNPLCPLHVPFPEAKALATLQAPVANSSAPYTHLLDGKLCVRFQASFTHQFGGQGGFTQLNGWLCRACHAASTFQAWDPSTTKFCNNAKCRYHVTVLPWQKTLHAGKAVKLPSQGHLVTEQQIHRTTFQMADKAMEHTIPYHACHSCAGVVKLFTLDAIYAKYAEHP